MPDGGQNSQKMRENPGSVQAKGSLKHKNLQYVKEPEITNLIQNNKNLR